MLKIILAVSHMTCDARKIHQQSYTFSYGLIIFQHKANISNATIATLWQLCGNSLDYDAFRECFFGLGKTKRPIFSMLFGNDYVEGNYLLADVSLGFSKWIDQWDISFYPLVPFGTTMYTNIFIGDIIKPIMGAWILCDIVLSVFRVTYINTLDLVFPLWGITCLQNL